MRVGVVGAGVAGLAAARTLLKAGDEVVVWERQAHIGGRVETVEIDGFIFDTGATSIAPRGMAIEEIVPGNTAVRIAKPIFTHENLRVSIGDPRKNLTPRYTYTKGNAELPKLLGAGIDIRLSMQIDEINRSGHCFIVENDAFDALILTPPVPQTSVLLWSLRESRAIANASYRCCLSIMLGFEQPTPETHYHALLDVEQRHPLTWLSLESAKCAGRAPEGWCAIVAQMSAAYSLTQYNRQDKEIIEDAVAYVRRLFPELSVPKVSRVRRWKYSLPETVAQFETVNQPHAKLILAGDGLSAGRVESAYESGVKAAKLLIDNR